MSSNELSTELRFLYIGGFVFRRYGYVKMFPARYSEKAYGSSSTVVEPSLGTLDESAKHMIIGNRSDLARADICIQDFKCQHCLTFLDVCVLSPVCQTNIVAYFNEYIKPAEERKKSLQR